MNCYSNLCVLVQERQIGLAFFKAFNMKVSSRVTVMAFNNKEPNLKSSVFVADGCRVIGDVSVQEDSSLWFNVVCRGDVNSIRIGARTNIQDNSLVHVNQDGPKVEIGNFVTVGHQVTLHGCQIKDNVLVGMGSCLLDGVVVGEKSIVAAGSLLTPNKIFPSGVLIKGRPAKVCRELSQEEIETMIFHASNHYVKLKERYRVLSL